MSGNLNINPAAAATGTNFVKPLDINTTMPEDIKFGFSKSNNGIGQNYCFKRTPVILDPAFIGLRGVPANIGRYTGMTYVGIETPSTEYCCTNNNLHPFPDYLNVLDQQMA